MPFSDLHDKFDPHIHRLFEHRGESEIRQLLHTITLPLMDKYGRYLPENLVATFKAQHGEGLSVACENAREDLDNRAADAEEEGATEEALNEYSMAGIVLEMMGYLDAATLTSDTVFNFVYCLGVFQTDESIIDILQDFSR